MQHQKQYVVYMLGNTVYSTADKQGGTIKRYTIWVIHAASKALCSAYAREYGIYFTIDKLAGRSKKSYTVIVK